MELKDAIEKRYSAREFTDEPVLVNDVKEMVRLAGLAPSINNLQPWRFTLITNKNLLKKMATEVIKAITEIPSSNSRLAENIKSQTAWYSSFFENAPALLAVAAEPYESLLSKGIKLTEEEINARRNFPDIQSVGACVENLLLAATNMEYGTCWLSGPMFAEKTLEKLLQIEPPLRLMTFIAIGKPKTKKPSRNKRNLADEMTIFS